MSSYQPKNDKIAELFENLGLLLEMKGDSVFKISRLPAGSPRH